MTPQRGAHINLITEIFKKLMNGNNMLSVRS